MRNPYPSKLNIQFGEKIPSTQDLMDEESQLWTVYRMLTPEDPDIPEWWPEPPQRTPGPRLIKILVVNDSLPIGFTIQSDESTEEVIDTIAKAFGGLQSPETAEDFDD